jgi:hypothetical protein
MLPRRTWWTVIAVIATIVLTNAFGTIAPGLAPALLVLQVLVLLAAIASLLLKPPRPRLPPHS